MHQHPQVLLGMWYVVAGFLCNACCTCTKRQQRFAGSDLLVFSTC